MKRIEMEIWKNSDEKPSKLEYVGQHTAQDVFAELEHRLSNKGFLPDEYFLLDDYWDNNKEIPKNAVLFSTIDYGTSEGIYIDVYLKWNDEEQKESVTQKFITGKTLGETEIDLDRMNLIASTITKCFHINDVHARYVRFGETETSDGCVLLLNGVERRLLIDSLVSKHKELSDETVALEKLLRRLAGNITEYINEMGKRPMAPDDFDMAVLAINDGCLAVFEETYLKTHNRLGELLVHTAARPGSIGKAMTALILGTAKDIPNEIYLHACKWAIETADAGKIILLVEYADKVRAENELSIYNDILCHAIYSGKQKIANEILNIYTADMIKGGNPHILPLALNNEDFDMAFNLIEKGIDSNSVAWEIIHSLAYWNNTRYYFKILLEHGMVIDNSNYIAMQACIKTQSPKYGKMLIDQGMDFHLYLQWSEESRHSDNTGETFDEIKAYWESTKT